MLMPTPWLHRIGEWLSAALSRRLAIEVNLADLSWDPHELTRQLDWGRD